jgi:hypothetical protein
VRDRGRVHDSLARQFATASVVDDVLASCALLFLVSTSLIFAALRSRVPRSRGAW